MSWLDFPFVGENAFNKLCTYRYSSMAILSDSAAKSIRAAKAALSLQDD